MLHVIKVIEIKNNAEVPPTDKNRDILGKTRSIERPEESCKHPSQRLRLSRLYWNIQWIIVNSQQIFLPIHVMLAMFMFVCSSVSQWFFLFSYVREWLGHRTGLESNCTWCAAGKYQTGTGMVDEANCTWCVAGKHQFGSGVHMTFWLPLWLITIPLVKYNPKTILWIPNVVGSLRVREAPVVQYNICI
jgi:hypothetical protein